MSGTITKIGVAGAGALVALGVMAAPAGANGSPDKKSEHVTCLSVAGRTQGRSQSDPDGRSNGGTDKPGCTGALDADRDGNNGCGNDADREDDNNGHCGGKGLAGLERCLAADADAEAGDEDVHARIDFRGGDPLAERASRNTGIKVDLDVPLDVVRCGADALAARAATAASTGTLTDATVDASVGASALPGGATGSTAVTPGTAGSATGTTATASTTAPGANHASTRATTSTTGGTEVLGQSLTRPGALARTGAGAGGLAALGLGLSGSGRLLALARRLFRAV